MFFDLLHTFSRTLGKTNQHSESNQIHVKFDLSGCLHIIAVRDVGNKTRSYHKLS